MWLNIPPCIPAISHLRRPLSTLANPCKPVSSKANWAHQERRPSQGLFSKPSFDSRFAVFWLSFIISSSRYFSKEQQERGCPRSIVQSASSSQPLVQRECTPVIQLREGGRPCGYVLDWILPALPMENTSDYTKR